jgi:hypothetical protein
MARPIGTVGLTWTTPGIGCPASARVGEPDHRRGVVRHDEPAGPCRPAQDGLVVGGRQADVLNADDVQVGPAPDEAADDVVVEVLVGQQPQHGAQRRPAWRASRRSRMPD